MEYRTLGRTGVSVSKLCLGTMMLGAFGNTDHDDCVRIIHTALDAGINFVDTADLYSQGESEDIVGKALAGRKRDGVVLATKVWAQMGEGVNRSGASRRWIIEEVENSLRRLKTDYIDLYQVHRPTPETRPRRDACDAYRSRASGQDPVLWALHVSSVTDRRGTVDSARPASDTPGDRAAAVLDPRARDRERRASSVFRIWSAEAGLVRVGVIAIDGTKIAANASRDAGRSYVSIVEELLADAERADQAEDHRHGDDRGDEPPAGLRSREERRQALAAARARLEAQRSAQLAEGEAVEFDAGIELDLEQLTGQRQGRHSWQREAAHQLEKHRERQADPIPRGRPARLQDAKRRLEQELAVDTAANRAYEQFHQTGRDTLGRRIGKKPNPHAPPLLPESAVNLTDPDSRLIHDKRMSKLQGYNCQAAVSCDGQIILRAELSARSPDFGQLAPVLDAALHDLRRASVDQRPQMVLADAGYWHSEQTDQIVAGGTQVLIPPRSRTRETMRPGWDTGRYAFMRAVLDSPAGSKLYHRRGQSIEPTFGQIKHNRGFRQFRRRGRVAVRAERRLITATHNLLKLHQHWIAPAAA
jgi:aldo/keto reductase family protein/DDE family transposase